MKKIYIRLSAGITDSLDRFNQTTYLYPETEYIIGIFISRQFLVRNNINKDSFNKLFAIQKDLIIFEDELPKEKNLTFEIKNLEHLKQSYLIDALDKTLILKFKRIGNESLSGKWAISNSTYSRLTKKILKNSPLTKIESKSNDKEKVLFLQYRLGDICLMPCNLLISLFNIEKKYQDFFLGPRFDPIHKDELRSRCNPTIQKNYINNNNSKLNLFLKAAFNRFITPSVYLEYLDKNSNSFDRIILSSDGLTKASEKVKKTFNISESLESIEKKLEEHYLGEIKKRCSGSIIGDSENLILPSVRSCVQSTHWQMGGGNFPFDFALKFYGKELLVIKNFKESGQSLSKTNDDKKLVKNFRKYLKINSLRGNFKQLNEFILN